jgi:hypothetical protein
MMDFGLLSRLQTRKIMAKYGICIVIAIGLLVRINAVVTAVSAIAIIANTLSPNHGLVALPAALVAIYSTSYLPMVR